MQQPALLQDDDILRVREDAVEFAFIFLVSAMVLEGPVRFVD